MKKTLLTFILSFLIGGFVLAKPILTFNADGSCSVDDGAGTVRVGTSYKTTFGKYKVEYSMCRFPTSFTNSDGVMILAQGMRTSELVNGVGSPIQGNSHQDRVRGLAGGGETTLNNNVYYPDTVIVSQGSISMGIYSYEYTTNGVLTNDCTVSANFTSWGNKVDGYNALQLKKTNEICLGLGGNTQCTYECSMEGASPTTIASSRTTHGSATLTTAERIGGIFDISNRISAANLTTDISGITRDKLTNNPVTVVKMGTETFGIPAITLDQLSSFTATPKLTTPTNMTHGSAIANTTTSTASTLDTNRRIKELENQVAAMTNIITNLKTILQSNQATFSRSELEKALTQTVKSSLR